MINSENIYNDIISNHGGVNCYPINQHRMILENNINIETFDTNFIPPMKNIIPCINKDMSRMKIILDMLTYDNFYGGYLKKFSITEYNMNGDPINEIVQDYKVCGDINTFEILNNNYSLQTSLTLYLIFNDYLYLDSDTKQFITNISIVISFTKDNKLTQDDNYDFNKFYNYNIIFYNSYNVINTIEGNNKTINIKKTIVDTNQGSNKLANILNFEINHKYYAFDSEFETCNNKLSIYKN